MLKWCQRVIFISFTKVIIFKRRNKSGYNVDYCRLPITDEQAPQEEDFNVLVRRMIGTSLSQHLIFNCQMGRGRTTTGMIVAVMWRSLLQNSIKISAPIVPMPTSFDEVDLLRGEYQVMMRLVRVLDEGPGIKAHLDNCIDLCGKMQNIREAIKVTTLVDLFL